MGFFEENLSKNFFVKCFGGHAIFDILESPAFQKKI